MLDSLIRACDNLWRKIILLRANGKCEICGASKSQEGGVLWVQACHIISRTYWSTRWDPRNGVGGCQGCHNHKTIMTWLRRMDPKRYNWIIATKRKQVSHRDIDLEKVYASLCAQI